MLHLNVLYRSHAAYRADVCIPNVLPYLLYLRCANLFCIGCAWTALAGNYLCTHNYCEEYIGPNVTQPDSAISVEVSDLFRGHALVINQIRGACLRPRRIYIRRTLTLL